MLVSLAALLLLRSLVPAGLTLPLPGQRQVGGLGPAALALARRRAVDTQRIVAEVSDDGAA